MSVKSYTMKNKNNLLKIFILIIILVVSILSYKYINLQVLEKYIADFGIAAPIIYIISFIILPIFFFPVPVLALVAGILFGVVNGSIYTIIGALINSAIMYYLSLFFTSNIKNKINSKIKNDKIKNAMLGNNQKSLFILFFVLRLIPLVSYNIVNYISGLTKIKISTYLISTFLGITPGTIVFLNAGSKLKDVNSIEFLYAIIFLIALIILSIALLKFYIKDRNGNNNNSNL